MSQSPVILMRNRQPALEQFGAAVEYFPNYTNTEPRPHSIDVLLVSLVARGRGRHWMNDAVFPEQAGSLGITHYGEVHSIVTDEPMDIYNLYLDPRTHPLPAMPAALRPIQQTLFSTRAEFRHRLNRSAHLHFEDPALPVHCLATMLHEQQNPSAGAALIIEAMLRTFLVICCRTAAIQGISPSLPEDTSLPSWLPGICRTLDSQYAEPLTLDRLAEQANISKSYLCRSFKKQVGLSVINYLTERRIQAAMLQLQTTDDKVLAVAIDTGFGDLSHFNRVFKQRTGLSPTAYRATFI